MATIVSAFYADARTLRDARGARLPSTRSSKAIATRYAVICGRAFHKPVGTPSPSADLTCPCGRHSSSLANRTPHLAFLSNEDWSASEDVLAGVGRSSGGPRDSMAGPGTARDLVPTRFRVCPPIWPVRPHPTTALDGSVRHLPRRPFGAANTSTVPLENASMPTVHPHHS